MFATEPYSACPPPIELDIPDGWVVAWETNGTLYKLKAYPLRGDMAFVTLDHMTLQAAQRELDNLTNG